MIDLNLLKSQGWLTEQKIIKNYGFENPSLMREIIQEKKKDFCDQCKIAVKRKNGNDDYIYSPVFVSNILNSFAIKNYEACEAKRSSLNKEDCYTAKELAREFSTTQNSLVGYINSEKMENTGLVTEKEGKVFIHKSLYFKLKEHFISNKRLGIKQISPHKVFKRIMNESLKESTLGGGMEFNHSF